MTLMYKYIESEILAFYNAVLANFLNIYDSASIRCILIDGQNERHENLW